MNTLATITVRTANAGDAERIAQMVQTLSKTAVNGRFFGGVSRDFADEELEAEVRGRGNDIALVAEDEDGAIVGEAYAAMVGPEDAEVAFIVTDRWQHNGVGTALYTELIKRMRDRAIDSVHTDVQLGNAPMLSLMHDAGLPYIERCADGVVHVVARIS